jgi:hypothetical protein
MQYFPTFPSLLFPIVAAFCLNPLLLRAESTAQSNRTTWLPGAARTVPRSLSGSRDLPAFEYGYGPRAFSTIGGEWGWYSVDGEKTTLRWGMYVFIALENHTSEAVFWPYEIWRAQPGFTFTASFDTLAAHLFGESGGLELGLTASHESDHGDYPLIARPGDIPYGGGGDFFTPDIAMRRCLKNRLELSGRLQCRIFAWGAFTLCPGADVSLRWRVLPGLNPFISLFAEGLFAQKEAARDGFLVRGLIGCAFPGKAGEFAWYLGFDRGNGKGLLVNSRETRISGAVRFTPFVR